LLEGLVVEREAEGAEAASGEDANPKDFPQRLRVGSEWRHEDGKGQRRHKPNGREPHSDLLLRLGLLLIWCSRTLRLSRTWKRERSGRCKASAAGGGSAEGTL
jgi:hypothetical protein